MDFCHRRRFLFRAVTAPWRSRNGEVADAPAPRRPTLLVDLHVHLMGIGDNRTGCRVSDAIQRGALYQLLTSRLQLRQRAKTLDEAYVLALGEHLQGSGVDRGVILAQDAIYDSRGRPDWKRTPFYVPNEYLFQITAQHPKLMIPCVGINPDRADAIDELERCVARGARILKIHPPIQGVDISDRKHRPFFRQCAARDVVVMVHTGHEHASPIVNVDVARPAKLRQALDEGCTVVACHCGTGRPSDRPDMLPEFVQLLREYERSKNLWGDTAVLGGYGRSRDLVRLLADEFVRSRLLHGSDFPFPAVPLGFLDQIGAAKAAALQLERNLIRQDFTLKELLGIGRASALRAAQVLRL